MSRLFFKKFHKSGGNFEKQKKESLNVGIRDSEKLFHWGEWSYPPTQNTVGVSLSWLARYTASSQHQKWTIVINFVFF